MNPTNTQRIIRISGGTVFLTPECSLPVDCTSLNPEMMRFKPGREFFWLTEIVNFNHESGSVELKVLDYNPADISNFEAQKAKSKVKYIQFGSLDWHLLEPQLAFYQLNRMLHLLDEGSSTPAMISETVNPLHLTEIGRVGVSEAFQPGIMVEKEIPVKKIFEETFRVYFTDATFLSGAVEVVKTFKWQTTPVRILIENSSLIPEFDLVKSFFPKVFRGQKKFEVQAIFEMENRQIINIQAFSPQIACIDDKLIEGVKKAQVMAYISRTAQTVDKSLFTADEFMDHYADDEKRGNTLQQTEADIILASLSKKELRNRKQIEFLAGYLQSSKHKIRFTLKPDFGFVFLIEGNTMNHFCWELLNSHATYLWSFNQASGSAEQQYLKVEQKIAGIRETGREQYKSSYRTLPVEPDMLFNVINHGHAGSAVVAGFPEWKHRLMEKLI